MKEKKLNLGNLNINNPNSSDSNKRRSALDFYKEQIARQDSTMQNLLASRYGANYQNNPNYNPNMGLFQPNMGINPNYSNNEYQQLIDLNTYLGAMQNKEHAQSALDQYKQLVRDSYSAKQEAEIQKQMAQLHMDNVMQNQGLGNQGIAESTQAKLLNQYANQVGNIQANQNVQAQNILRQYQQAIQGVNQDVMQQNVELSYMQQQEQAEQNLTQFKNEISKYVTVNETTGKIKSVNFNSIDEIEALFNQYRGKLGINDYELNADLETIKEHFIKNNLKADLNKPTRLREDEQTKVNALIQQGQVKDGTIIKTVYSRVNYNQYFVYYKGQLYPINSDKYKKIPNIVLGY